SYSFYSPHSSLSLCASSFSQARPRHPRPTLFPYTTLFRSGRGGPDPPGRGQRPRRHAHGREHLPGGGRRPRPDDGRGRLPPVGRSEEHTSELQSRENLVCRLLLEKKKNSDTTRATDDRLSQ